MQADLCTILFEYLCTPNNSIMTKGVGSFFLISIIFFVHTVIIAQPNKKIYPSGFYKVNKTQDPLNGFWLAKDTCFYALHDVASLPLNTIDSVTHEFLYGNIQVTFHFKPEAKKSLLGFTTTYRDQQIGLLVNGELLLVAHIVEPIAGGKLSYSGSFDNAHVKHIENAIQYELNGRPRRERVK